LVVLASGGAADTADAAGGDICGADNSWEDSSCCAEASDEGSYSACVCVFVCMSVCADRQQAADSKRQTAGSRQQTADSRQQAADSRQQTADRTWYFLSCACSHWFSSFRDRSCVLVDSRIVR
jgi:hypothetical protein